MLSFIFNPFTGNFDAILIGANQALSNLTSPTAINQSLLPNLSAHDLGSNANPWNDIWAAGALRIPDVITQAFFLTTTPTSGYILVSDSFGQGTWQDGSGFFIPLSQKGAVNGVATLDGSGKVPVGQLPSVVMEYQGSWNPNTNTPALSDGTGANGNVYYVTALRAAAAAGNTDPSMVNFQIGDLVIYSSSVGKWQLVTPAAGVSSVNGAQGAVTVNAINQLTGDATAGPASGSQSQALTLATVNANVGTFASVTVNAKGLVTAAAALSGDATTSGAALTLATVNANVGSFGSSTSIPSFTVNAKGLITAASGNAVIAPAGTLSGTTLNATVVSSSLTSVGTITTGVWNGTGIDVAHGGTGQTTLTAHDVLVGNGASPITQVSPSTAGFVLTSNGVSADPSFQASSSTFTAPTVQTFTSGSGTYTTPTSPRAPLYIKVRAVGGGGGGGGSGVGATAGNQGGTTTFGTSLISCTGGVGGGVSANLGATGGTATYGSGPLGVAYTGAGTGPGIGIAGTNSSPGASSPFGGGGYSNSNTAAGGAGAANSGSGGGGAGSGASANNGGGGAAGGYVDVIITSPASTYSYAIGASSLGGAAGTSGFAGGAGAAGFIIIEEFYQ